MNFKNILIGKSFKWTLFRLLVVLIVFAFYFHDNFKLIYSRGDSMSPTMGDKLLLLSVDFYESDYEPQRYDVVVVWDSLTREFLTKRIIGLPDEKLAVIDGLLFIEDELLIDDLYGYGWFDHNTFNMRPQTIPYDMYYVIGDNREDSVHGLYFYDEIVGKVLNVD